MKIKAKPTAKFPDRMMVTFAGGHAVFNNRIHAEEFTGHPGGIGRAALMYLDAVK